MVGPLTVPASVLRVTGTPATGKWVGTDGLGNVAWLDPPPVADVADADVAALLADPATATGAHLAATTAKASAATRTVWVSPTGDDDAAGTQFAPVRTIARALSAIPDVVRADHVYTIRLLPGAWDEIVDLRNRIVYGQVIIEGSTSDRAAHKVRAVRCYTILGHLNVQNLTTTIKTAQGQSFLFSRCTPLVDVNNVLAESDPAVEKGVEGVIGLLADYGSSVRVRNSDFGGKRYGIRSNYLARVFSSNNTGSGNTFGVGARWGGIATIHGTHPTGDTDLTTGSGGMMSTDQGGKVGTPQEPGLLRAEAIGDGLPRRRLYHVTSSVAAINSDIAAGDKLQLRFRGGADGYITMRATYGGQINSSNAQSMEKHFYGVLFRGSLGSPGSTLVSSQGMTTGQMTLVHTGTDGQFDLIVEPTSALAGRWGVEVEISMLRSQPSPILQSITLLPG